MPLVFLLFVAMPIIEIAVLIQIGRVIGVWSTVGIVILTAIVGTAMLRQQGLATLASARQRLDAGELPARQLLEGLLLVVGGVLLLTPGFVTDTAGFLCLLPPTRAWLASQLARRTAFAGIAVGGRRVSGGWPGGAGSASDQGSGIGPGATSGQGPAAGSAARGNDQSPTGGRPTIIEGDFRRDDPE